MYPIVLFAIIIIVYFIIYFLSFGGVVELLLDKFIKMIVEFNTVTVKRKIKHIYIIDNFISWLLQIFGTEEPCYCLSSTRFITLRECSTLLPSSCRD